MHIPRHLGGNLVLISYGPDRGAAEYLVRKHCLQKDVFFLGKQDNLYEKLAAADLFLMPPQLESFGLVPSKPWPAKSPSSPQTSAAFPKSSSMLWMDF